MTWWGSPDPHAALSAPHDLQKPLPTELAKQLADGLLPPKRAAQARDYLSRLFAQHAVPSPGRVAVLAPERGAVSDATAKSLAASQRGWAAALTSHFHSPRIAASLRVPEVDGSSRPQPDVLGAKARAVVGSGRGKDDWGALLRQAQTAGGSPTFDLDALLREKSRPVMTGYGASGLPIQCVKAPCGVTRIGPGAGGPNR